MQKRAMIIYNPAAGKNKFRKLLPDAERILTEADLEVTLVPSTPKQKSTTEIARHAAESGYDIVIAAGGDGTVNEVVNGLMQVEKRPKLGILPVGTTNDYARALNVAKDPLEALHIIATQETIRVDIGKANENEFFINNAAGGRITEITYAVKESMKSKWGRLAYLFSGLTVLPKLSPVNVEISYNDEIFKGEILLFFVNKSNSVGGMETLCPPAELNSGMFELLILKKVSPKKLFQLFASIKKGTHLSSSDVIHARTGKVEVKSDADLNVSYDGVYGGKAPYILEVIPEALEVFADEKRISARLRG
ncbi:diacylglycerol kinase family lipid kinase [Listeria monocytogenes]|uniref:diacylglycerol kinase family lipid kinase n=2 Tax=Listeria TaxID=1637 RepID=UPI0008746D4B|nr:diacylglycerol kinase family lipid kinase [Listeria monocytogenes]EAC2499880.1 YegS/Rv2252/BmrU family lipid kinase [Listeria monocytogenes]ECP1912959.1 diacylglycerol kinase family lipid kinase [Listeria monocytogenes]EKZ0902690.1 diacylglycerol kinase family lipid kinase [Listeria monocytogenes]EKZ1024531.1 diacylglycerol kinase family lipid kinase [Listeria monocytogenes]EKZ1065688.1 diacylglycerol kinase family lipid kinase [Listeria monocytogenes]